MTALWLTQIALLCVAFFFIFWPLMPFVRKKQVLYAQQQQENIDIFRDRLNELEQEKEQGTLQQTTFLQLKTELEKSLLQDVQNQESLTVSREITVSGKHWLLTSLLGVVIIIVSVGMYFKIGRSDDLALYLAMGGDQPTQPQTSANNGQQPPNMAKAIEMLQAKIAEDPNNKEKLFLLANTYSTMGQFNKAATIYEKMAKQADPNSEEFAGLKGAQAQSLFQASGERMTDAIQSLIDQAIAIDPNESSSLMLLGIKAYFSNEYKDAVSLWNRAKIKASETQITSFIDPAISATEQKLGTVSTAQVTPQQQTTEQTQVATDSAKLVIDLSLNESLKSLVNDQHTLFVFARPAGGRMPLAVERIKVKDLPIRIVLDDTKAAMPTAMLSSADKVDITARVSLSGQPRAQKGDLYATLKNVPVKGSSTLVLEIDQVVK